MLIVCPNCTTPYDIATASLGPAGRSVRCVRCRAVWLAAPVMEPATSAQAKVGTDVAAREPAVGSAQASSDQFPVPTVSGVDNDPATLHTPPMLKDVIIGDGPTVEDAPSIVPDNFETTSPRQIEASPEPTPVAGIEAAAERQEARIQQARRRRALPGIIAALISLAAIDASLIWWRTDIVRIAPGAASLYAAIGLPVNLRGLELADVKTTTEIQDGAPILAVEGRMTNPGDRPLEAPRLRFAVRNGDGQEIYAWVSVPAQPILAAGESLPFRSRLAAPPAEGREIAVRFFHHRDLAGAQ